MSVYQKDSLGWQLQRFQQQLGEWWEGLWQNLKISFPQIPLPSEAVSRASWEVIKAVLILALILLIIWLIWRFRNLIAPYWAEWTQQAENQSRPEKNITLSEWVKRSQRARKQGNYYQACRCLYFAMLQHLDEKDILPEKSSRTDEEYRYLLLRLSNYPPYDLLFNIHQQLCFSTRTATPALFEECQQAYREIVDRTDDRAISAEKS